MVNSKIPELDREVSTHSRTKAAATEQLAHILEQVVSTHSRTKAAARYQ